MSDEVAIRVRMVVARHLGLHPENILNVADFFHELGADSLDSIELVVALEDEFDCLLPDDTPDKVRTLGDLIALLNTQFSDRHASAQRLRAANLAATQIDVDSDRSASIDERADRKRQLIDGPEMVRSERVDRDRQR